MYQISPIIVRVIRSIGEVLECLSDKEPDLDEIEPEVNRLERGAKECEEHAKSMMRLFGEWSRHVDAVCSAFPPVPVKSQWRLIKMVMKFTNLKPHNPIVERSDEGEQKWNYEEIEEKLLRMSPSDVATGYIAIILRNYKDNVSELEEDVKRLHALFHVLGIIAALVRDDLRSSGCRTSATLSTERANEYRDDLSKLRVHFTIAADTVSTYLEISQKHIIPGVNMAESLTKIRIPAESVNGLCREIADYSRKVQADILALEEKRAEFLKNRIFDTNRRFEPSG